MQYNWFTNTEYERLALANKVNLSDGHARQTLSTKQREIVGRTLELLDVAHSRPQEEIEAEFLKHFFQCGAQEVTPQNDVKSADNTPEIRQRHVELPNRDLSVFFAYSSSSAIKIAAQYCRIRGLKVYLIEPCFDNILHLLVTEGVTVIPIREEQLNDVEFLAQQLGPDAALWLVQPNNPTGFCMEPALFKEVIDKVAERQSTIIIDFCFRFYAESLREWDQYRTLEESKVTFIGIEDTGKTWSLGDLKVGMTLCSSDAAPVIHRLHDELLLNVSPLQLLLLTECIKDTLAHGIRNTARREVEINRELVLTLVEKGLLLRASEGGQNVPMELLGLPHESLSTQFWSELRQRGVDILPAHNYYWSNPEEGKSFFRMPLSRPLKDFQIAVPIMEQTLLELRSA